MTESNVLESNVLESNVLESNVLESNVLERNVLESNVLESNVLESSEFGTQGTLSCHSDLKKSTCSKWARLCRYGNPCPVSRPF